MKKHPNEWFRAFPHGYSTDFMQVPGGVIIHRSVSQAESMCFVPGVRVEPREDGGHELRPIEYEDEDPKIRRDFEAELARRGIQSRMS